MKKPKHSDHDEKRAPSNCTEFVCCNTASCTIKYSALKMRNTHRSPFPKEDCILMLVLHSYCELTTHASLNRTQLAQPQLRIVGGLLEEIERTRREGKVYSNS